MRYFLTFAVTLLVFATFATAAIAESYTAEGVQVTIENQKDPRGAAIIEAQKKGLRLVLEQVSGQGADAKLPTVADEKINDYVLALTVEDEKFLGNRYIGSFSIQFLPDAIDALMRSSGAAVKIAQTSITASAPINAIGDWILLRQKLERIEGLEAPQLLNISHNSVNVSISGILPLPQLIAALRGAGIEATLDETGVGYILSPLTAAEPSAPPASPAAAPIMAPSASAPPIMAPATSAPPIMAPTAPLDALADPSKPLPKAEP